MKLLLASAFVLLLASSTAPAQSTAPVRVNSLELRLLPGALTNGIPDSFTFEIVNVSNHDIRVPQPSIDCGDGYSGFIWLRLQFKPLNPSDLLKTGFGCAGDRVNWPPILERAQQWRLLHPGEFVSQTVQQDKLHYESTKAGVYEFWADYTPPATGPEDQRSLRKAQIDFPSAPLSTPHQLFTRKP